MAASLGNYSLRPIVTTVCVIPPHLISCLLSFFHLISSHCISCLLSLSHLFSADHSCSPLFSCHLSFSHDFCRIFTALLNSSQLSAADVSSSYVSSSLLSSSHTSADLSSCQLVSHHLSSSQRTLVSSQLFSAPKPSSKTDLAPKQATPAFPQRSFRARLPSKTDS